MPSHSSDCHIVLNQLVEGACLAMPTASHVVRDWSLFISGGAVNMRGVGKNNLVLRGG